MKSLKKLAFLYFISSVFFVKAQDNVKTQQLQNYNTDNWVATDALGRETVTFDVAGPVKKDKKVGVFYYIWHGYHSKKVYDITNILKDPKGKRKWGPKGKFHFWGEPEQGYYNANDPWVLRRDLQMLTNAKVDFIYLDVTNHFIYPETVKALFEMGKKMRSEGIPTPDITFTTNSKSGLTVTKIYNEFYKKGLYKDQWFLWDGKPVIMANPKDPKLTKKAREFFTIKYSWAWTKTNENPNHWQWVDTTPQDYGWSKSPDIPEQIPVSVAGHPVELGHGLYGTSRSNGKQPKVNKYYVAPITGEGAHFQEQWDRALEVNPEIVMVTQWNEWLAQRFIWDDKLKHKGYAGRPIKIGDSYFVDAFTEEFNRDMAPMKGGHTDNYYYQLVSNIRKFKGMKPPVKYTQKSTIKIDGNFEDWQDVQPEFYDPTGDTMHRDFKGYDPNTNYKNKTGRNDIISAKVGLSIKDVFFYVKTQEKLTSYKDDKWMLLFIDTDKNSNTGWEGYEYVVNYEIKSSKKSTLKKWNGVIWENVGSVTYRVKGNELELSVLKDNLNLKENIDFYFKWADNPIELKDVTTFFMNGDTAPDRRFKYHFKTN
ncbi:hypothetical protein FDT66_07660 [Polaribacter aestuariivivens]|uniref:Uncharacterized protein n=1 Tax=Polaribacter aestuariivivens TaxID=2304626 RepID=A0A5S3N5I0_9FLAO|nr:hypothetical protein [Polaribacter aestuariivivens]TMM30631.1 hypothetical protein FDT66_07660 [Polaribacter aestuariivivens]